MFDLLLFQKSLIPAISECETDIYVFTVSHFALGFGLGFHICLISFLLFIFQSFHFINAFIYLFVYLLLVNGSTSFHLVEVWVTQLSHKNSLQDVEKDSQWYPINRNFKCWEAFKWKAREIKFPWTLAPEEHSQKALIATEKTTWCVIWISAFIYSIISVLKSLCKSVHWEILVLRYRGYR